MDDLGPYIGILAALVAASAFFSGSEVALFSLRRVDRERLLRSERTDDALILRLLSRPRRLIATLLIGNETVNVTVSALLAGMAPVLYPGRSELELALLSTFTALPILLLLGEITPKTIAIKTPASWARAVARPLLVFGYVIAPIRGVVRLIAGLILRPLGGAAHQGIPPDMSEDEFKTLVDAGSAEGQVDARERRLIHKVFEFGDKTVAQVMEPRARIFALSYDLPVARLIAELAERGYSRVPIYQKTLDNIRGVLYAKDLVVLGTGLTAQRRLGDLLHEPLFVPRTLPVERLFRIFKQRKTHMALVVNEYGKLIGLVTMDDLLEEVFGEIRDEREQQKERARPRVYTPPGVDAALAAASAADSGAGAAAVMAGDGADRAEDGAADSAPINGEGGGDGGGDGRGDGRGDGGGDGSDRAAEPIHGDGGGAGAGVPRLVVGAGSSGRVVAGAAKASDLGGGS